MRSLKYKKKIVTVLFPSIILLVIGGLLLKSYENNKVIQKSALKLNTYITVTLYGMDDESFIDGAFEVCDYYESLFSKTISTSDVSRFNNRTTSSITIDKDTSELMQFGLTYSKLSNGAFDIAIGRLSSLWDFTSDAPSIPDATTINDSLNHIGYENLIIKENTLSSKDPDLQIDLGGIAKGYIADKMKEYLISKGVKSATINLGGNVLCIGKKPDGAAFKIGIQKPFSEQGEILLGIELVDYSVVTSGTYERYFIKDNKVYHHILNPTTGYPYDNGLVSVTILSPKSVDGDGLSTSCFALGLENGMKLINSLDHVYAIFVTDDDQIYYSDGTKETFKIDMP